MFAYVFEGEGRFNGADPDARQGDGTMVLYGPGSSIEVSTDGKPVRFLLVSGKPLQEPIAWHGPIVMNTQAEIRTAFREYQEGTFVKKGRP